MTCLAALQRGDFAEFARLLDSVTDIDALDDHGWTLLNWAAGQGALPFVRALVEKGADVFARGRDNRTPYLIALAAGRLETMAYLKAAEEQRGGDLERRSSRHAERRQCCRGYRLEQLRAYRGWTEPATETAPLAGEAIVFVHQDYSVTRFGCASHDVLFAERTPAWRAFCDEVLKFTVPADVDLVPATGAGDRQASPAI